MSERLQVELDRIAGAMRLLSISGGLSEVVGAPVGGQSGDGLAARRVADSMRAAAEVGGPAVSSTGRPAQLLSRNP